MAADLPSGRLVFFFSDVEGSTRLLTDLGARFTPLLAEHQRLVRASLADHGGIEISTEGDSFFAVFLSPLAAVIAAAETQRRLAAHPWPSGHDFRVRIGLHLGQAVVAGDDYVGIDVNRASRIANAGNGGQVVMSDEVTSAVGGHLPAGLTLRDLGRHRLRDIGATRLWQLDIDGLATPSAALRTLEAHPSNLPAEATPLVDRENETAALLRLVSDGSLVTITGAGGIGKSRLAIHVARMLLADFPDGVFYLDLAPLDRIETVVMELGAVLDARIPPSGDAVEALLAHLRDRRALLVLDTADRHPGIAGLIARVADNCPSTRVLVTARAPLHVRAERELSVQPLDLPGVRPGLEAALASPAVELYVRRAQAIDPGFQLTEANVESIVGIVGRLDGLPLAVELAAAATRSLSPSGIFARLERSLPLPGGGAIDAPERHRTLRDTIAWSYQLLDPAERSMLQRLSVFAGAFDLDGVEALAADDDGGATAPPDSLEVLGRLVDRSLVHRVMVESAAGDRYRLLGMVREFAAAASTLAGDTDVTRHRHARYWLDVATRESALLDGPGETGALASLDRAGDEFRAALQWSIDNDHAEHLGLDIANALARSWYLRGRIRDGAGWLQRALTADPAAPREVRARTLHWLGVMFEEQRDDAGAIERLEEALAIQREIGDERAIARELNSLGVAHRNMGAPGPAESLLTESLTRRRASGDTAGVATVLTNLGILAIDRGQFDRAIELLREGLSIDRAAGASGGIAYSSLALGTALLRAGTRDEALELLRTALATFHDLEDADGIAESLERLGEAAAIDEPARAARLLLAAASIREREMIGLRAIDELPARRAFADAAAALSTDELDGARADASAMDAAAAVAYALADR